ncbi:MAG: hypothetical protein GXO47_09500 [Chlorobi bacterium]|nr:hypothetical protein [Chlorobiota bacterium]
MSDKSEKIISEKKYMTLSGLKDVMRTVVSLMRYNLKVVFGNKFVYFLGASVLFYLIITALNFFSDEPATIEDVYYQLMFPSLLIIFFPTVYGIQNDEDARILEIIFGIPNYRYKVWLVRLFMILVMAFVYLLFISFLSNILLVNVPVIKMTLRLMVPITFFSMLGFFFSTLVKNGNGSAVLMVITGLAAWILSDSLRRSKWNVFLNPFHLPRNMSEAVYQNVVESNQLIFLTAALVALLWGLINLQNREKFV